MQLIDDITLTEEALNRQLDNDEHCKELLRGLFQCWKHIVGKDVMLVVRWQRLKHTDEEGSLYSVMCNGEEVFSAHDTRLGVIKRAILWAESEGLKGLSTSEVEAVLNAARLTREEVGLPLRDPMAGIDYATTGPMWSQPGRVGVFRDATVERHGAWIWIDVAGSGKGWTCEDPREVASRCGVLVQGRTYRWLFHKATGDLVGWREEPLPKVEPVPKPKATEPVGVPHEGFSGAGVFLRWEEARLVFRNEMGWEDYWCSHGPDRDSAIARCGDLVSGKRYRWLWDSPNGGLLLGWREEPLPKADTVSKHKCEMCGAETEQSYQDMAKVCNGCLPEFHNTVWACLHVARAMYGDKTRVKLYRDFESLWWKVNVVNESRANTGIMGKNDGKVVRDAFEALCQEAVSPCFPHPDDGPLEARLDAIGEAAMRLGAGVYGAADG